MLVTHVVSRVHLISSYLLHSSNFSGISFLMPNASFSSPSCSHFHQYSWLSQTVLKRFCHCINWGQARPQKQKSCEKALKLRCDQELGSWCVNPAGLAFGLLSGLFLFPPKPFCQCTEEEGDRRKYGSSLPTPRDFNILSVLFYDVYECKSVDGFKPVFTSVLKEGTNLGGTEWKHQNVSSRKHSKHVNIKATA